jgi:heavy metal sensor kinase
MTIRRRLTLWFMALLAGLMVARSVFILGTMTKILHDDAVNDTQGRASQIREFLEDLDQERRSEGVRGQLPLDQPETMPRTFYDDGMLIQYADLHGQVEQRSPNLSTFTLPIFKKRRHSVISLPLPHFFLSQRVVVSNEPLRVRGRVVGSIQVGRSLQYSQRTLYNLLSIEIATLLIGLLLALISGYWLAGLALRPISRMSRAVNRMQATDLHRRLIVPVQPTDEIETLGATFNRLFDRLEEAFESQNRFVADASHELKSPLTAIRGHAQLIMKRGADNPDQLAGWSQTIIREADRLSRLVGELLMLAKGDHGVDTPVAEPVDLGSLAREVATSLQDVANRSIVVSVLSPDPVVVAGSPDRLRQVLINLIDNALRATQRGGEVSVRVAARDGAAELVVEDSGYGIAAEHLDRLFDRFYRVDAARDRAGGGTGLGLAIVASIMRGHGGTISVSSEVGAGTTFTVRIPLPPRTPHLPALDEVST